MQSAFALRRFRSCPAIDVANHLTASRRSTKPMEERGKTEHKVNTDPSMQPCQPMAWAQLAINKRLKGR